MRKMKDSKIEWVGEVPETWSCVKGKYILTYLQKPVKNNDGVITCFRDGEVTLRSNRREDGFTVADKEIGYQGVDIGDLIVHGMDGFAGAIGISDSRGKASPVLNVLGTSQNKKYLMYYLRSMAFNEVFIALSTGIRVRSCDLRWNKLAELLYLVPPIEEQQRIADFLDRECERIDGLKADIEEQIETLEKYKRSVITEAVTRGLNLNVPMKDSGIPWIGNTPANWENCKLKNICSIYGRIGFRGYTQADLVDEDEGAITLSPSNIQNGKMIYDKCSFLSWYKYHESPEIQIKNGDILFVKTGSTYGKTSIVENLPMEATINPQIVVIKEVKVNKKYLYYYLLTPIVQAQVECAVIGGTIPTIAQSKILNFTVFVPPLPEQQAIADYLDEKCAQIDQLISQKQSQIETLETYKKSLIFEYVTGKKEVCE